MSPLFAQFCEQVCLLIRWKAARGPVADELAAHLEDHAAALMERGIRAAWEKTDARRIRLESQSYAQGFYEKLGFRRTEAPEFLDDGIPHMEMVLERKQ